MTKEEMEMSDSFNWTCPYCKVKTTIVKRTNMSSHVHYYDSPSKHGHIGLYTTIVACPNPECKEIVIQAELFKAEVDRYANCIGDPMLTWTLKPESSAMPLPDYIPQAIRDDYYEACRIVVLSPKASATLSRRCLQGMVRDFWKISKGRLVDEINELQGKIDTSTWESIDAIRSLGNIGAHMEKDVNLIIDIDADEAGLLIHLLEDLFQDWYIAKHEREERNNKIKAAASGKAAVKVSGKVTATQSTEV